MGEVDRRPDERRRRVDVPKEAGDQRGDESSPSSSPSSSWLERADRDKGEGEIGTGMALDALRRGESKYAMTGGYGWQGVSPEILVGHVLLGVGEMQSMGTVRVV